MRGDAYSRRAAVLCAALLFPPPSGTLAAGAETEIELTCRFALTDNLALQPDLQYVINPAVRAR